MEAPVNLISQFLSFVTRTVYFSVEVSCFIGYHIVGNFVTVSTLLFQAASNFLSLLHVIIEDFYIFISDLFNALYSVAYCLQAFVKSSQLVYYYLTSLGCMLYNGVSAVGNGVINSITSVCNLFLHLLWCILDAYILIRNTTLFIGLNVWNFATGLPEYVYSLVYQCLQKGLEGVYHVHLYLQCHILWIVFEPHILFSSACHFIMSSVMGVPVKPICGLSIAISCVCFMLKKRRSLMNFAYHMWMSLTTRSQQVVVSAWQTFEGYVLWLLTNQRRDWPRIPLNDRFNDAMFDETETDSATEEADSDATDPAPQPILKKRSYKDRENESLSEETDTSLCVVCQDKIRSMLTLPCRHVCLCNTCCTAIRTHQGLCPLCRQEINFAGRVYL